MMKRRRQPDSDGTTAEALEYNTVFVDTSLDTHLAMIVSKSDTVSDFKQKMVFEHTQCFPKIEIRIHSLKVKRKGKFYHLPDSMLVWTAFHGRTGNWFLSVDASSIPLCLLNENSPELGISNGMKMDVSNDDNNCRAFRSDINRIQTLPESLPNGVNEKKVVSEMITGFKVENYLEKTSDIQISNFSEKICLETESPAKKKRKLRHAEDVCHNSSSKGSDALFPASGTDTVIPDIVDSGNSLVDAVSFDGTAKVIGVGKDDQSVLDDRVAFEETSIPSVAQKVFDERKEETVLDNPKLQTERTLEGEITKAYKASDHANPDLMQKEAPESPGSSTKKMKKKRKSKMANKSANTNLEKSGFEKPDNAISGHLGLLCPSSEHIPEKADMEESILYNKGEDWEDLKSLNGSSVDAGEKVPGANGNEADIVMLTRTKQTLVAVAAGEKEMDMETQNSADNCRAGFPVIEKENQILEFNKVEKDSENTLNTDKKFKNKSKKILTTSDIQEKLPVKDKKVGVGASTTEENPVSFVNSVTEGVHISPSPDLSRKSEEKLEEKHEITANGNEADIVMSTRTKQTLEAVASGEKEMDVETQNSAGNGRADFLVVEKENQILELSQVEKDSENTLNTDKKVKKKRKKILTTSDIQEKLPVKDQKVGVGTSTTEENPVSFVNSVTEGVHVSPSPDLSRKSEEKLEEKHEIAANGNEADIVMSTRTKQTLEAVPSGEKEMDVETQNSAGNGRTDFLVVEKDNQILELSQVEKDSENTLNTDKKVKKKRKKILTTSDIQEKLPVKDQKVGVGTSTTEENPVSFVNSVTEGVHASPSPDLSRKSEEKLEEKHEIPANVNEADIVMSTQTKQTVAAGEKEMDVETQNSAGNGRADVSVVEKEDQILELNQVEKDSENALNINKKVQKKRMKKILTASDVQQSLRAKDQKVGFGASTTKEISVSFVNTVMEGVHVSPSPVLSRKIERKLEKIAFNTDDLAKTTEDEGEEINFKQYIMSGQFQDKVGSDKVKRANQSNEEMKTTKKLNKKRLPSVSVSTEAQSPLKLSANQKSGNKSRLRKDGDKRHEDSAKNSDLDEVLQNPYRRFSSVLKNGGKDSSTSEMRPQKNLQKPKEMLAESSFPSKKNASLKKPSSEGSKKFPGKRGNKDSPLGVNVTNRLEMKTPKKKSLLAKPGAIFQDNSGESSGDENEAAHSSGSTGSPSDSSSMSGHSVEESDLSQAATRNGTSDVRGRSTGVKDTSKLDISSPEDVTMHTILKSSKRFKKAKLIASQNEADQNEPIEFVPDRQPM